MNSIQTSRSNLNLKNKSRVFLGFFFISAAILSLSLVASRVAHAQNLNAKSLSTHSTEDELGFNQFIQELETQLKKNQLQEAPAESQRALTLSLASSVVQFEGLDTSFLTGFTLGYGKRLHGNHLATEFGIKYFSPSQNEGLGTRIKNSTELFAQLQIFGKVEITRPYFLFGMGLRNLSASGPNQFEVNKFSPALAIGAGIRRNLGSTSALIMGASAHPFFDQMTVTQTPLDFTLGLETMF
jgi:hypothetical protein